MTTVYRVQDVNGEGPYRRYHDNETEDRMHHSYFCPDPDWNTEGISDMIYGIGLDYDSVRFAFTTLEALHVWFGESLSRLLRTGYRIVEIETDEVIASRSRRQCVISQKAVAPEILF